ncbi:renin, partial [Aphelenchoides avenae]
NTKGVYEQNASITLGGLDSANCEADWFFAPKAPYFGWTARVSSVAVDGVEVSKSDVAGVVFMSLFILGPPEAVKPIVKLAEGKPHPIFPFAFVVDCKKANTLPTVTFHFDEHAVTLDAADYIFKDPFPRAGGRCVLAFGVFPGPKQSVDMWAFGASFFNAHCFAFDWERNKIGFATAKQPKSF